MPTNAPTAMAMRELMMRLRSSLRCSKKVMAPPDSSGGATAAGGGVSSWAVGVMRGGHKSGVRVRFMSQARRGVGFRRSLGGGFFGGTRHGFGNGGDDRPGYGRVGNHEGFGLARIDRDAIGGVFGGRGFCAWGSALAGRFGGCWFGGSGAGGDFGLLFALGEHGLALEVAHFRLEGGFEGARGFAELSHELAQPPREFGKLLRPENNQDHDEDDDHVRDAEHSSAETARL